MSKKIGNTVIAVFSVNYYIKLYIMVNTKLWLSIDESNSEATTYHSKISLYGQRYFPKIYYILVGHN